MKQDALEARVEAIELFLQQLVFLLEAEPNLNNETITQWLLQCRRLQRDHAVTSPPVLAAFGSLIDRVLEVTPDPEEPDAAARKAADAGMKKAATKRPPKR